GGRRSIATWCCTRRAEALRRILAPLTRRCPRPRVLGHADLPLSIVVDVDVDVDLERSGPGWQPTAPRAAVQHSVNDQPLSSGAARLRAERRSTAPGRAAPRCGGQS